MAEENEIRNYAEAGEIKAQLIVQAILGATISAEDQARLERWFQLHPEDRQNFENLRNAPGRIRQRLDLYQSIEDKMEDRWSVLCQRLEFEKVNEDVDVRPRVLPMLSRKWVYAITGLAASVALAIAGYQFLKVGQHKNAGQQQVQPIADLAPGRANAWLTLASGKKVLLDSSSQGLISQQGQYAVKQTDPSSLSYDRSKGAANEAVGSNTLETPRGAEYSVKLADGTRAYLNALSSITYPTAFNGKYREVTITGEVYFDVVHNARQPFRVRAGNTLIEDIGTSFDVNDYKDENHTIISLVEGSARVSLFAAPRTSSILKPGDQAITLSKSASNATEGFEINPGVDLDAITAWHKGLFSFRNSLSEIMPQLSRWYNVDVAYEGKIPDEWFHAKISRNISIENVLRLFEATGHVHFRLEQGKITVIGK
jgi:ferric-dicitrate binding protein FerR (iron transport regulator)